MSTTDNDYLEDKLQLRKHKTNLITEHKLLRR
jgi:hypothetical protein